MRTMDELQQIVEDELGEIVLFQRIAPGIYEAATRPNCDVFRFTNDHYIVECDSPVLSAAAKKYGKLLETAQGILTFNIDEADSGKFVVEYELTKYLQKNGQSKLSDTPLIELVTFGREHHPEYFGPYPVPMWTPWGQTARYWCIDNGIHWIETSEGQTVLSLSYPFWECELTNGTKAMGTHLDEDLRRGVAQCLANIFFLEKDACVPIFELSIAHSVWIEQGKINRPALMNAIWEQHPEFAMTYNTQEQMGGHDILGMVLNSLGGDIPLYSSLKNIITITAGVGSNYLNL